MDFGFITISGKSLGRRKRESLMGKEMMNDKIPPRNKKITVDKKPSGLASCLDLDENCATDLYPDNPSPEFPDYLTNTSETFFQNFNFKRENSKNISVQNFENLSQAIPEKLGKLNGSCSPLGPKCSFDYGKFKGKRLDEEAPSYEHEPLYPVIESISLISTSKEGQNGPSMSLRNFNGTITIEALKVEDEVYRYNRDNRFVGVDFSDQTGLSRSNFGVISGGKRIEQENKLIKNGRKAKKRVSFGKTKRVFTYDTSRAILDPKKFKG